MRALRQRSSTARHLETWLWTGPVGHLVGGTLDFAEALRRYRRARRRRARAGGYVRARRRR